MSSAEDVLDREFRSLRVRVSQLSRPFGSSAAADPVTGRVRLGKPARLQQKEAELARALHRCTPWYDTD